MSYLTAYERAKLRLQALHILSIPGSLVLELERKKEMANELVEWAATPPAPPSDIMTFAPPREPPPDRDHTKP
jgi:hypothetical protein